MRRVHLDFETVSELDVRTCGAERYARHASTRPLCLCWAEGDGDIQTWTPPGTGLFDTAAKPPAFLAYVQDCVLVAHNAAFEAAIWQHVMAPRYGWPAVQPWRWTCTAARCAAMSYPRSLADAACAVGLDVRKDAAGKRTMMKLSRPGNHKAADYQALYRYCRQDVEVERKLDARVQPLTPNESTVYQLNESINRRGVLVDTQLAQACADINEDLQRRYQAELARVTDGALTSGRQTQAMVKWLRQRGVDIATVNRDDVAAALETVQDDTARRVLQLRQLLARSAAAKFQAILNRTCDDGRVRGSHVYHRASTGRFAGTGVQFQNVPRGVLSAQEIDTAVEAAKTRDLDFVATIYDDVPAVLNSLIRPTIVAPEGRSLFVVDFAGIENRVLAWLAGQQDLVDALREGVDTYRLMAAEIFDVPVAQVTKDQRGVGKQAVLGCGYGMGWRKFQETAAKQGREIDEELARRAVDTFRTVNSEVRAFWREIAATAIRAVKDKRPCSVRCLTFQVADGVLWCRLPNGRRLAYVGPQVGVDAKGRDELSHMTVDAYTHKWTRRRTYGGMLAENVVQAVARDILVRSLLRLDAEGFDVVMHVHDEVVAESKPGQTLDAMESIMRETPSWCDGLPIAVEGFESIRYRK